MKRCKVKADSNIHIVDEKDLVTMILFFDPFQGSDGHKVTYRDAVQAWGRGNHVTTVSDGFGG